MNKLEWEMSKQRLKFSKEICENIVKLDKNSLLINRICSVVGMLVAILLTFIGVDFLMDGKWAIGILDILLAIMNIALCIGTINRNKVLKRDLESGKVELERLNSEIQSLEGMVL